MPTILYLHIPKAAGTTLARMLAQGFRQRSVFTIENTRRAAEELANLPEATRDSLQLIKGHFAYGLHEGLRRRPFEYVTMLREPLERVVSHYYYVLRNPEHYLYGRLTSQKMGLKDYALARLTRELDNGQVRFISGMFYRDPYWGCQRDLLEQAKENLRNHFAVVGLAERFDETVLLMAERYGWKDLSYTKKNATANRPHVEELPKDTVEAIRNANSLDMELYAFAAELFEAAVRRRNGR